MINNTEQVFELDCDLDTLICWLQTQPQWAATLYGGRARQGSMRRRISQIIGSLFPPQIIMTALGRFTIRALVVFFKSLCFDISDNENLPEKRADEPANSSTDLIPFANNMQAFRKFRRKMFDLSLARKAREKEYSPRYLEAFGEMIIAADLQIARKRS